MSEDKLPIEPTQLSKVDDSRVDSLESRIAQLEDKLEANALSAEDEYNSLLRREIEQRITSRRFGIGLSVIVIFFMAYMATHVLKLFFIGSIVFISSTLATALFVAPIISISAVTITLLIGVFRRFHDNDLQQVNKLAVIEGTRNISGL